MIKRAQGSEKDVGVAPVIGFILIIAIMFIAAAQYQANVVPERERVTEANHFTRVTQDFLDYQSEVTTTASTGQRRVTPVETGFRYGVIGLTNPPTSGTFVHRETFMEVKIQNAINNGEAGNYWTGDTKEFDTGISSYRVNYNRYQAHPNLYMEHGYVYGDFAKGSDEIIRHLGYNQQPIVRGQEITIHLVQVPGNNVGPDLLSQSKLGTTNVVMNPTSAPMKTVPITNTSRGPISISLPTRLNETAWENDVLNRQLEDNGGRIRNVNVTEVDTPDAPEGMNNVTITLQGNTIYNLRISRVDLQTQTQRSSIVPPDPTYIASTTSVVNIREESTINLDAEVRDKYNNGVSGTTVRAEAVDSDTNECIGDFNSETGSNTVCDNSRQTAQPGVDISGADGSVGFVYDAPPSNTDNRVDFIYRIPPF